MSRLTDTLHRALRARYPLLYLLTYEEERVLAALAAVTAEAWGAETPVRTWSCTRGLDGADPEATRDPVAALQAAVAAPGRGCFVFRDLPAAFARPEVVRALREAYAALAGVGAKVIAVTYPRQEIPPAVEKEFCLIPVDPPDEEELLARAHQVVAAYPGRTLPPELDRDLGLALKGLTLREVEHTIHRVCALDRFDRDGVLDEVLSEKENIVRKSGYLEFVPQRFTLADVGGLDNLKDWLRKRRHLFSRDAVGKGLPIPRGMLIMGVSGCGKSLCAKAAASLWGVPLFRLDMNLVFSGMYGSPEEVFHLAARTVEAVAPVVLWVDEVENGLASISGDSGQTHIFSAFLTWMQEKPPLIFVAATANRIEALPAEILRKGRFDEVFFVDLPGEEERRDIFSIHLRRQGADPGAFDLGYVLMDTDGWNGAEIEQAVLAARVEGLQEDRAFTQKDLGRATSRIVPLSATMREQIKSLRDWAYKRATVANKKPAK